MQWIRVPAGHTLWVFVGRVTLVGWFLDDGITLEWRGPRLRAKWQM